MLISKIGRQRFVRARLMRMCERVCQCALVLCAREKRISIGGIHCSCAEGCRLFLIHHADLDSETRRTKCEMLPRVSVHAHTQTCQTQKKTYYPMSHPNMLKDLSFPFIMSYLERSNN